MTGTTRTAPDLDHLSLTLEGGDYSSKRQALQSLRHIERDAWANVSASVLRVLVTALQRQLECRDNPSWLHKETATILGNIGPGSKTAIPELMHLLRGGIPDPVDRK